MLVEIEKWTLKQTLILAVAKNYFNRNGFCPTYGKPHAYSYGLNRSIFNHYQVRWRNNTTDVSNI